VESILGAGTRVRVLRRGLIHRRKYPEQDLDVLCDERVVEIRLRGDKAPALVLRGTQIGGPSVEVRVGMTLEELETALGAEAGNWDLRSGTGVPIDYRYYQELGVGFQITAENKVSEIIVAQIPYVQRT
jgi:hypothetical protein